MLILLSIVSPLNYNAHIMLTTYFIPGNDRLFLTPIKDWFCGIKGTWLTGNKNLAKTCSHPISSLCFGFLSFGVADKENQST